MTEQPELDSVPAAAATPASRRRRPLRRIGCIAALVIWFAILLLPCFIFTLAMRGEITVSMGDMPDQALRIWLIMEIEQRGVGISTPSVHQGAEGAACLQTDVRYFLWQGEAAEPVAYCECYTREDGAANWSYVRTLQGGCAE